MRTFFYFIFLLHSIFLSYSQAQLWVDDAELFPSDSGIYSLNHCRFSVIPKGESFSLLFVENQGEIVLRKQPQKPIKLPFRNKNLKERISLLQDYKHKILCEETWQADVSRNSILKQLRIQARTIRYATKKAVDIKYEGPLFEDSDGETHIYMKVVSCEDTQTVLGQCILRRVPFILSTTPEPVVRYITHNGEIQEVKSTTASPNVELIKQECGVEIPGYSTAKRRIRGSSLIPHLGDISIFRGGYVRVTEDTSEEDKNHPLHIYIDEQKNYRGVYYRYWKVRKEKDDFNKTNLVTLHSSSLLMDLFEGCMMTGHMLPGYYEFLPQETMDGVVRTTLKMLMGDNRIHFQVGPNPLTHNIDLSRIEPTPALTNSILHFARKVQHPTKISYRNSPMNGEELRKQGDFIHEFLSKFLRSDYTSPNPNVVLDIGEVSTGIDNPIGVNALKLFKSLKILVRPASIWFTLFEEFKSVLFSFSDIKPTKIMTSHPLADIEIMALTSLVKGNDNLREICFSSSLDNVNFSSNPFKAFAKALMTTKVERISIKNLSIPKWKESGLSNTEIHRIVACAEDAEIIDLSGLDLPERSAFERLLTRSSNTLMRLVMDNVSGFSDGHFMDLRKTLPLLKNINFLSLKNVFLITLQIEELKRIFKNAHCTPAAYLKELSYRLWVYVSTLFGWSSEETKNIANNAFPPLIR